MTSRAWCLTVAVAFFPVAATSQEGMSEAPVLGVPTAEPRGASLSNVQAVSEDAFGIHVALNVGLIAFDFQHGHFYAVVAGNAGVPLLSNGTYGAFLAAAGFTTPLSSPDDSMWYFDVFGEALPGFVSNYCGGPYGYASCSGFMMAVGAGVGFRYLHRSGFTFGLKFPIFGLSFGPGVNGTAGFSGSTSLAYYYMANGIALPIISFGYRF